ncbi:MAG: hypothetical protein B7Y67_18880 [Polynucleobacter sp. 35-46-11]|uniref:glycosyltransferase n=1 Tax=Polynucleobacter sp. 35-46-11 TaxID=1970425 RepID=UPI000BC3CD06|nr:MAG: hypothetical protein B7Y67_18880 [Polynucleobacter sp. 35-46-11]
MSEIHNNLNQDVELVIIDGASTDGTSEELFRYCNSRENIRFEVESCNSGLDRGYDRCVEISSGKYCWLLSDDDKLKPGAINKVVTLLKSQNHDLFIANSEVWDSTFSSCLIDNQLKLGGDIELFSDQNDELLIKAGSILSFIGSVIIKRSEWLNREREAYFGSWFIHIGVIFQDPLPCGAFIISDPLIQIRYGVASWSGKSFDIWMKSWPKLIWSMSKISDSAKKLVVPKWPGRSIFKHILFNSHSVTFSRASLTIPTRDVFRRLLIMSVYLLPCVFCNIIVSIGCLLSLKSRRLILYDMAHCSSSNFISRWLYKRSCRHLSKVILHGSQ